jgi:hypothetical protein
MARAAKSSEDSSERVKIGGRVCEVWPEYLESVMMGLGSPLRLERTAAAA